MASKDWNDGRSDASSLEYVSRRLGKTRIEVARQGEVAPEQAQAGLGAIPASNYMTW